MTSESELSLEKYSQTDHIEAERFTTQNGNNILEQPLVSQSLSNKYKSQQGCIDASDIIRSIMGGRAQITDGVYRFV